MVWVPHPRVRHSQGPLSPGSAIPRVPHSQGPTVKAVFQGNTLGVEPPVQNLHPRKRFIMCFGGSILTPLLINQTDIINNVKKKRQTEIFRQKVNNQTSEEEMRKVQECKAEENNLRLNASMCKEITSQSPRAKARKSQQLAIVTLLNLYALYKNSDVCMYVCTFFLCALVVKLCVCQCSIKNYLLTAISKFFYNFPGENPHLF